MKRTLPASVLAVVASCLFVLHFGPVAASGDLAETMLAEMRATCASSSDDLIGPEQTWAPLDLGPDMPPTYIFVSTEWGCPEPPGMFWHTGGGEIMLRAEGVVFQATARGWTVINLWETPVVLLSRHGGYCDGAGYQPCFEAVTWSEGRWLTVGPPDG